MFGQLGGGRGVGGNYPAWKQVKVRAHQNYPGPAQDEVGNVGNVATTTVTREEWGGGKTEGTGVKRGVAECAAC